VDYTSVKRCSCMKDKDEADRQIRYRKFCQLPEDAADMEFSQYRTGEGKRIYSVLQDAKKLAMEMAEGIGDMRWLVLMAEHDRGKSHLAKCICKRWLERGQSARYVTVPDLLIDLREGFKKDGEQSYFSMYQFYCKVSLLVLDDLGMEYHRASAANQEAADWAMEQLELIVNNRYENERYMVVTTNKTFEELSPRIASRIRRYTKCKYLVLDSPEYRTWRK
jgi:DNA replication protein DnaC